MCATIGKYERKVDQLDHQIYPKITEVLDILSCYRNVYDYAGLEYALNNFSKEYFSLISLERKLVFPAVLSVFNNEKEKQYFPNISEIIQLTQTKDTKLKNMLASLQSIIEIKGDKELSAFEIDMLNLYNLFKHSYFPSKQKWISLLSMLTPESVSCENRAKGTCKCDDKEDIHEHTHHNESSASGK